MYQSRAVHSSSQNPSGDCLLATRAANHAGLTCFSWVERLPVTQEAAGSIPVDSDEGVDEEQIVVKI